MSCLECFRSLHAGSRYESVCAELVAEKTLYLSNVCVSENAKFASKSIG